MTTAAVNGDGATNTANNNPVSPELRRVVAASVVGTALEWYDFFIYGFAVTLVFNELFFVTGDPATGTLVGFATFGVGFAVRPFGGFLFGHLGDRIGRRATLIITTLVMGISTGLIGLLPTYASIGIAAPILLTLLRMCQGLGAGAEFGGASTLLAEHAPPARQPLYGALVLDVNVLGPFRMARAFAPALRESRGAVVNIASISGYRAGGSSIAYGVSKAALLQLTRNLAVALAPDVRVNAVAPGTVATRWQTDMHGEEAFQRRAAAEREAVPLKQTAGPEHVAQAVLGLLAMDLVTGETVILDGGKHVMY